MCDKRRPRRPQLAIALSRCNWDRLFFTFLACNMEKGGSQEYGSGGATPGLAVLEEKRHLSPEGLIAQIQGCVNPERKIEAVQNVRQLAGLSL